jgi:hypothetical protein
MNLPIINDAKLLIFTRTIAPIFTKAKNFIGDNLLNFFIRNLVNIAPTIHPNGIIPMSIDCAANLFKEILYSNVILDIGTEVIYFKP